MKKILFWFRRDLRINDNHGLYQALVDGKAIPCFILDSNILSKLDRDDTRVNFIWQSLLELKAMFNQYNSDLLISYGDPKELIVQLANEFNVDAVYTNEDYEPYALTRDEVIKSALYASNIDFHTFQDQVVFAKIQILNQSSKPYTVYTPYKNAWLFNLENNPDKLTQFDSQDHLKNLYPLPSEPLPELSKLGFNGKSLLDGGEKFAQERLLKFVNNIDNYNLVRDFPASRQTSHLGVDLRFGSLSVRQLVKMAMAKATDGRKIWLNELIWREFFSQILYNFPYVADKPFNQKYANLGYQNNPQWFEMWCNGETGYPIVDAGMRELNQTGFMHNRVRMITASFLCKDLLIDWRWGEAYFSKKLLDYELASNNGNWQWCASTGCDAQPYFRVFNPMLQAKKFDPDAIYIKRYIPELKDVPLNIVHDLSKLGNTIINSLLKYPLPIVNHQEQSRLAKSMFS